MKRAMVWFVAVCATVGLVTTLLMGTLASPAAAASPSVEGQFLTMLNATRVGAGLGALTDEANLTSIARGWSDHLLAAGSLSHNTALTSQLPTNWLRYGENVGMGGDATSIESAFMGSPEHRANILGDYNEVGVGVDTRSDGTIFVTVDFLKMTGAPTAAACTSSNPPNVPAQSAAAGYYVLGNDGGIFSYNAPFLGSVPGLGIRARAVLMSLTPDQHGYWILGSDGGVFTFGDARFLGSVPGVGGHVTGVDLKPTPTGRGYWILGQDGSVFSFGDAPYLGSPAATGVHTQAVKLVPTPSGHGYWILDQVGAVYSFGDAGYRGSLPSAGVRDAAVSMASTPSGAGYWILGADGGIFSFGDAAFHGSVPGLGCQAATGVQLIATATGAGYYILSNDGRVFAFGDAPSYGEPASLHVTTLDLAVTR